MLRLSSLLPIWMTIVIQNPARAAGEKPVWLVGNDFHTSIVLRARDVPFREEITEDKEADYLAFGFGASADYRGPSTPLTVMQAIFPNRGALHVVPVRGPLTRRFPHSDVALLWLKPGNFDKLVAEINGSFAFTADHRRIDIGRGVFPTGRFYESRELFYFPYVCNMWVALKLTHAGVPFFLPRAILANSLILQAGEKGITLQRHDGVFEAF